jgi:hypothetical protein
MGVPVQNAPEMDGIGLIDPDLGANTPSRYQLVFTDPKHRGSVRHADSCESVCTLGVVAGKESM